MEFVQFVQFTTLHDWTRCVLRYLCGQWVEWPKITAIYHFAHGHIHCVAFHLYILAPGRRLQHNIRDACVQNSIQSADLLIRHQWRLRCATICEQVSIYWPYFGCDPYAGVVRAFCAKCQSGITPSYRCHSQDLSVWGLVGTWRLLSLWPRN